MKTRTLLYCFVFALSANLFATAKSQVKKSDSLALVDLYNSTNGPGWTNNTNWLTSKPVSTWYGVYVPGVRVTRLALNRNNLIGNIPASIGNLETLQYLNLSENQLNGHIPGTIGDLIHLKDLYLYENNLNGHIPPSIGNLAELYRLGLSDNQLSGSIPKSIGNLAGLNTLSLEHNQLSGSIPTTIGNIKYLRFFYLDNNQLSGSIPASIGKMIKLRYVQLNNNQLSGEVPTHFRNLGVLYYLDISHNQLSQNSNEPWSFPSRNPRVNPVLIGNYNRFTFNGLESCSKGISSVRLCTAGYYTYISGWQYFVCSSRRYPQQKHLQMV